MSPAIALLATVLVASGPARAAPPSATETARNRHGYTLTLDTFSVRHIWRGDAEIAISACPQAGCFHLSGPVWMPTNPATGSNEGTYSMPGLPCVLDIENVPRDGMDSGDWRVTPRSRDRGGKGCATLPAGLAGIYRQPPWRPAKKHAKSGS